MVFFIGDDVGIIKPQKKKYEYAYVCECVDGKRNERIYNNSTNMIDI